MSQLSGMTGFARAEGQHENVRWVWEVRSVNGKGLEVRSRVPSGHDGLDLKIREQARKRFTRGNLQASLNIKRDASQTAPLINRAALDALLEQAEDLILSNKVERPRLDGLLAIDGILETSADPDPEARAALEKALLAGLGEALDGLKSAREEEGAALTPVLSGHIDKVESLTDAAEANAATRIDAIRDRLSAKIAELVDAELEENRLAAEIAMLTVKMDVCEELDRLRAHVASARELLKQGSPVGRKLDFLSQEFNREANTLCSKSSDSSLTQIGLDLKNVIDQFREQIQNVE
ncbi:MAG: YicC/YloC family endoribonuclease [Maricaulis sp.]|uniref:YicC/YloC family endoribonuclease n=1 Tax=Maricaulis sp. TaxID=1486257 RepID=UPI0026191E7C|nr:YicC/YloC family endoribonuclease [Maricaulis sp.]MDM7983567.1 YicC/YloC family endoribonuclease [Maricaulis sp.]